MNEGTLRAQLASYGQSLFARGYGCGTSGNLSARTADGGYLLSPTNLSLGVLSADGLTRLDQDGSHVSGPPATKEAWLHLAIYRLRPETGAVVHLHSTYAVAASCLTDRDAANALPPVTPYEVMRFGKVAMVPYFRPGDPSALPLVEALVMDHRALLLANHGPVVWAGDLSAAVAAAEELEEAARRLFILQGQPHRRLSDAQIEELNDAFGVTEGR